MIPPRINIDPSPLAYGKLKNVMPMPANTMERAINIDVKLFFFTICDFISVKFIINR